MSASQLIRLAGDSLGCITDTSVRQQRVREAAAWSWHGYRWDSSPELSVRHKQEKPMHLRCTAKSLRVKHECSTVIGAYQRERPQLVKVCSWPQGHACTMICKPTRTALAWHIN
jgi:hypothetical protein